jgi:hypothetical protein
MHYCKKCLAPVAICACALAGAYLTGKFEAVGCGEFPRPDSIYLCGLPPVDMPHNEPGDMPGRPLPNLVVSTSSSTVNTTATTLILPTLTST